MIDLHAHTNASDGSSTPAELVGEAVRIGLEALAITDHDILAGYDAAAPIAKDAGLELICGIEVSVKYKGKSVHLLGYFLDAPPKPQFRDWLKETQASRRDRNRRLVARLNSLGIAIKLEDVERRGGVLTGRPHFAAFLVEKGYVTSTQQAFDEYLDESAKGYVDRREAQFEEAVERIVQGGGLPSIAHPVRISRDAERIQRTLEVMKDMGLQAIEVYHSDHDPTDVRLYLDLAKRFDLLATGGSDYHGTAKPQIKLGTGRNGNIALPRKILDDLRALRP